MNKISVALAVFNEQVNIARCLDSVSGWVDEIVIVDGGSTDQTRQIAKKYTDKVYQTDNKPIFHINKQMAIDRCQGDWILQLDADEVVEPSLKKEVIEITKENKDQNAAVAYWIPRKNFFLGRWLTKTGQYPDFVIRFFKKGKAVLPCKSVHEQMKVDGKLGYLKGHLIHHPYADFSEYLKKSDRYTSLTAQELLAKKLKPGWGLFLKSIFLMKKDFLIHYLRCKGFMDGFAGFVFSFYSGLHHLTAYVKFWELSRKKSA